MIAARRFFLLFVVLLASLVLYPFTQESTYSFYLFRFLGAAIVVLSVYTVSFRRSVLIVALFLAVPALLQVTVMHEVTNLAAAVVRVALTFAFSLFIVVVIFRRVFSHEKPSAETVFGALCIYLLVGFTFAGAYGMLTDFRPAAFYLDPATNAHRIADRFDFIYYSFATLTSVGAAGITPVSGEARSLTVIESILGVLYLAVLIARLMGAYRPPERSHHAQPGAHDLPPAPHAAGEDRSSSQAL